MSFEKQLHVWSIVIGIVSWAPLAMPVLWSIVKPGSLGRKAVFIVSTFAASWALPVALFVVVVAPALWSHEPLSRMILAEPEHSPMLKLLHAITGSINSYWYFVGQIAVPIMAAVVSIPLSLYLSRKLVPAASEGAQRAA